ncbi:MAG: AsmA family protein, partial [Brevundimonas sp.]
MRIALPDGLSETLSWPAVRGRAMHWVGWVRDNDPVYKAARRPGRLEIGAGVGALLLIVAVVIFLALFNWNWLRGPIGRWASAKYDREVAIQGDLDVNLFSWSPSATVNGLKFGGPAWAREKDTANVEKIEASVRLRKLFAGQIEIPRLAITRPDLTLIADKQGRQSWELEPDKPATGSPARLPVINQLLITDGHVTLDEQKRGMTLDATVTARDAVGAQDDQAGFLLDGRGALNGAPLTLRIEGGAFVNIRRDTPYHFTADLRGSRSHLAADGSVTRPFDLGRFQATLTLEGQDLADLYTLTGIATPNTPPYRLSGALSRDDALWTFNDFSGRVGASDLSGDLKVDKVNDRMRVEAQLVSRRLDLDDMLAIFGARTRTTAAGDTTTVSSGVPGKLLPDAPLQVDRLRAMDGSLTYRAQSVKANDLDIRQVNLGAELDNGILNLDPVSFNFNRGELNGTARINAQKDTPHSAVDFRLAGYPLESIIPATNGSV